MEAAMTIMRTPTSSAAFPKRSSAASSPSSLPPRAPHKHLFYPPGGANFGATPCSTLPSTKAPSARRASASLSSPRSSLRTLALPAVSPSTNPVASASAMSSMPSSTAGSGPLPSMALRSSTCMEVTCSRMFPCLLPSSALRLAPTLCIASIGHCDFAEINDALTLSFPRLKQLKLYHVSISEPTLHRLLAGCTILQSLDLRWICGLSSIRIISPTLRTIGISVCDRYDAELVFPELVIEDAPCLERLIPHGLRGGPRTIRVIAAPKLVVLGYLSRLISKLVIGTISVKEMIPIMLTTTVRIVKVLVLESIGPNLDAIVAFLRCFPCMEKLYIKSRPRKDMKNVQQYDTLVDPIKCLDLHLRAIVVNMYQGLGPDVNFAKFFVLNAKVLKVMKFGVYGSNCNAQWMADQHRELQLDSRAGNARFDFVRYNGECTFSNMKHTHDMSIADPFDSSLCKCCSPV